MKSIFRAIVFVIALTGCVAVGAAAKIHLDQRPAAAPTSNALIYLPKAEYLRPMSLGYENVLADILWFRAISYFGAHYRADRLYPWLAHMCDLVTDLDPRAEHVYRFAGVILPWEAGEADEGIRLLHKGARVFPDSWLMQYWLGFNYYFFKNDFTAAATHLRRAAELPGAHPNAARLAALMVDAQHGPETAIAFLQEMEQNADDSQMREVVQRHILEARLAHDIDQLQQAVDGYRTRFGRVPPSLDALVAAELVAALPQEPFGGSYRVDPESGAVSSTSGRTPSRLHESPLRKKLLRGTAAQDL